MLATDVLKLLGFARRARKVVVGATGASVSVRRGNARLIVLACDLSAHTQSKMMAQAAGAGVEVVSFGTKRELGQALGRDEAGVVVVTDARIAEAIRRAVQGELS